MIIWRKKSGQDGNWITNVTKDFVRKWIFSGLKFTVQPTPDFKPKAQQEADCSVLLKLKKGDEYKLVLNMQQYSPENITVKLNGNELTVLATAGEGSTDDFKQTHQVPEGIDLDQMTSSFSSDGVLVIKAPRKK